MDGIKERILSAKGIIITTHRSPDGDAIGSSLALYHCLKQLNPKVCVVTPDEYPDFLKWMPGEETIKIFSKNQGEVQSLINEANLIFCLDYNGLGRIGDLGPLIEASDAFKMVIDHHQQPEDFADQYIVDVDTCSTSELIYDFIVDIGEKDKLNKDIASCIYCGIMTDTGSFRFPSTKAKTHHIIADLIELGAENAVIHQQVYDNYSEHRLRLLGFSLTERMLVYPDLNAAIIYLSQKDLNQFNFEKGDTEGIVNYPLSIKGIRFSAMIMEKDGKVKMSLRSQGDFSVNEFARKHFSGGGHNNAAGGISEDDFETTVSKMESLLKQYKEALNS